jgi:hypothetical protein
MKKTRTYVHHDDDEEIVSQVYRDNVALCTIVIRGDPEKSRFIFARVYVDTSIPEKILGETHTLAQAIDRANAYLDGFARGYDEGNERKGR